MICDLPPAHAVECTLKDYRPERVTVAVREVPTPPPPPTRVVVTVPTGEIPDLIRRVWAGTGQEEAAVRVVWCESRFDPHALNRSSGAAGLAQFMPGTWAGTPQGRAGLSPFDAEANIRAALWLWQRSGWGPWSCKP